MKFLLLGYGSIGTKHAGILRSLGHEVVTVDPDPARGADYHSNNITRNLFDGVLDCTPPDVRAGWDIATKYRFVEKPLGKIPVIHSHEPIETIRTGPTKGVEIRDMGVTQIGFCYHYLPSLAQFVNTVKSQPLAHLLIIGGLNLQLWHEQDYRTRKYWGVATDSLPHSLYIARWILGNYSLLGSYTGRFSDLEIKTESTAGCLLLSADNVPCYCEVDYLRVPRLFRIEVVTANGAWHEWEFDPAEAPMMYQRQIEAFAQLCGGWDVKGYPNLDDGIAVQKVLDEVTK